MEKAHKHALDIRGTEEYNNRNSNKHENEKVVWHSEDELCFFHDLAAGIYDERNVRGFILQCGIYTGGSACAFAMGLKDLPVGYNKVIAIDPYHPINGFSSPNNASNMHVVQEAILNREVLGLRRYLTYVIGHDVDFVSHFWRNPIRIALIDTSHMYRHTVEEIYAVLPHIQPGGWLLFHDYYFDKPNGVNFAVDEFFSGFPRPNQAYEFNTRTLVIRLP